MPEPTGENNNTQGQQVQGQNNPANNSGNQTGTPSNNEGKNVSREEFNSLYSMVKEALSAKGNSNNNANNNANQSNNNSNPQNNSSNNGGNSNNENNNNNKFSIEDDPEFKALKEKYNNIQQKLDDASARERTNQLKSVAKKQAETHGIKIDGVMDQILLGGDEATVKQNVDNIADAINANANQSTNNGFSINSSNGAGNDKDSVLDAVYARHGINRKK